jgi:hypothetical protein
VKNRRSPLATEFAVVFFSALAVGGCALATKDAAPAEPVPVATTGNGEAEKTEAAKGEPAEQPGQTADRLKPVPGLPQTSSPWTVFSRVRNGYTSNIDFNQSNLSTYGGALVTGVEYEGDDFEFAYEIAGHQYLNSNRWDRISQVISASYEFPWGRKWDFQVEGTVGFKGSSDDRDLVDRDFEISPRFDYLFTKARRLRVYTKHRAKRYDDTPETNAIKNYLGVELLETMPSGRHVELGARYETNDEVRDRSDSVRWSYWAEHGIPLTERDLLVLGVRYRLKRYTRRFVEVEDEDVLRADHRWTPSVAWVRRLGKIDFSVDYAYETTYSNDPEREYRAHLAFTSLGYRWK